MLFLASGTVVNGLHSVEPTTPISRLVEAENESEARAKFVAAINAELGTISYLHVPTVQVNGVIT